MTKGRSLVALVSNMVSADEPTKPSEGPPYRVQRPWYKSRWLSIPFLVFGSIAISFILAGLLAPKIAPYDPFVMHSGKILISSSPAHPLGTDELGRDLLSRMLYGARLSLTISISTVLISFFLGVTLGTVAAYFGGILDMVIMRLVDVMMSFPSLILIVSVVSFLGSSVPNLIIVMGLIYTPGFVRIMYSTGKSIREKDYVNAARAIGASIWRICLRHIIPNAMGPLLAHAALSLGFAVLTESGLSFLGLGPKPPTPTWGQMITVGRRYIHRQPLLVTVPIVALSVLIVAFNILSDSLRDLLDPRLKKR